MTTRLKPFLVLLIPVGLILQAHEFWIQPDKFRFQPGEKTSLKFQVGENLKGEAWGGNEKRVQAFRHYSAANTDDIKRVAGKDESWQITLHAEGTHLIAMESDQAFSKLAGEEFNRYLEEDGLHDALDYRKRNKQQGDSATELYTRHSKLLLQAGSKTDSIFSKVVGHKLEIIPERNPYAVKVGEKNRFKVLFNGKPAFGLKVMMTNRDKTRTNLQYEYTEQDGSVELTMSSPGTWLISVVKMERSADPKAQWKSYWASLMFGI